MSSDRTESRGRGSFILGRVGIEVPPGLGRIGESRRHQLSHGTVVVAADRIGRLNSVLRFARCDLLANQTGEVLDGRPCSHNGSVCTPCIRIPIRFASAERCACRQAASRPPPMSVVNSRRFTPVSPVLRTKITHLVRAGDCCTARFQCAPCPVWVISGQSHKEQCCPLYPPKQTSASNRP